MATITGRDSLKQRACLNLAAERQKTGISLEHIAETTKISMRFLKAIEAEDFSQLPGGIFNTSYLRQYAKAIGYDEAELLAQYNAAIGCSPAKEAEQPPRQGKSLLGKWFRVAAPLRPF